MSFDRDSKRFHASRRGFLRGLGGAALAGGATAGGMLSWADLGIAADAVTLPEITSIPDALKGTGEVRVVAYGGAAQAALRKAFFEPFEKLSGIKVVDLEGADHNKVRAMVDARAVEWDCVQLSQTQVIGMNNQGKYWQAVDYGLMDTTEIPEVNRHSHIPEFMVFSQIMAYRTDVFKDRQPDGWADFWNEKAFPGPRAMVSAAGSNLPELEYALMAAGVPPDQLYPLDIEKAFASLSLIRPHVVKWWDTGAVPIQLISSGEVAMTTAWNGRVKALQDNNVPVQIGWKNALQKRDGFAIPEGAPNSVNAQKFLAFSMMAIPQARYSMQIPYGFTNRKAAEYIPAEMLAKLPTSPEHQASAVPLNYGWWSANRDKVVERWNRWILE